MASAGWVHEPERGSQLLTRFMAGLTLRLGWHVGNVLLYPITAYFFLSSPAARAASRRFLTAALGRRPGWGDLFRHQLTFAATILDRPFLLTGRLSGYDIRVEGLEHVKDRVAAGQGCLLLGAHLGSFEVLRALAELGCPVPVRALMYEENAARVNAVLDRLNPGRAAGVIPIGTPTALLRVKEALAAGELVGLLGDRVTFGEKVVSVDFLGRSARLPVGPMVLAAVLGAPMILFSGVHRGGRRYEVRFEPFAERVELGRGADRRQADLAAWVQRYARHLEAAARAHPYNWFNFYDFWDDQDGASTAGADLGRRQPAAAARGGTDLGRGRDRRPDGGAVAGPRGP
jgi:predicted LPLAT superfamily acyltransferase